jgi:serine/threonine protein phosphatase PrpC
LEVDLDAVDAVPGDCLLLCTDGLSGYVEDRELEAMVCREALPDERCRDLVDAANERGGQDNITAIVIDLGSEVGEIAPAADTGKPSRWRALFGGGIRRKPQGR